MDREEKLIHILEERQEDAIRRIAYNNRDSVHSANSLSSTNSNSGSSYNSNRGGGVPPGGTPVGHHGGIKGGIPPAGPGYNRNAMVRSADLHTSPVGWDKSYPLRPMGDPGLPPSEPILPRTPSMGLYKRNSTVSFLI